MFFLSEIKFFVSCIYLIFVSCILYTRNLVTARLLLHHEFPRKLAVCIGTSFQSDFVQGAHETGIGTCFYGVAKEILEQKGH